LLCKEKGGRAVFSKAVGLFGGIVAWGRRKNTSEDLRGFHDSVFHDKIGWLILIFAYGSHAPAWEPVPESLQRRV
jgi:hypothetical protein